MKTIAFSADELRSLKEYFTQQLQTAEHKVLDIQNILKRIDGPGGTEKTKIRKIRMESTDVASIGPAKRESSYKKSISIKDLVAAGQDKKSRRKHS